MGTARDSGKGKGEPRVRVRPQPWVPDRLVHDGGFMMFPLDKEQKEVVRLASRAIEKALMSSLWAMVNWRQGEEGE